MSRRLEDNLQLGAQLGFGTRVIGVAQHLLPEPPAGGQQRVISDEELVVVEVSGEAGVLEMASQFALVGIQTLRDGCPALRLLEEDGLTNDTLDIGIRELHAHLEPGLKPLQTRRGSQRRLTGANQKKTLVQCGAAMLRDFLHIHGTLDLLADELLNFVHNEQRAGELPVGSENLRYHVECIINCRGTVLLELIPNSRLRIGDGGILRLGTDESLGEGNGELQAEDFSGKVALLPLERVLNLGL